MTLEEQAEALGIKVDGRWSEARIQQEIDAAKPKPAERANVPIRLRYDCWFKADERTAAGTVLNVSIDDAKRLIANGKAERADPLPGEA